MSAKEYGQFGPTQFYSLVVSKRVQIYT